MAAIGTIRNRMGGILIAVLVIAMLSFLFMDIGGPGGRSGQAVGNEVANVNGVTITNTEFNNRFNQNLTNYQNQTQQVSLSDGDRNLIRTQTYDQMVTEVLNEQKYEELGIMVSDEEYADMLTGKNQNPELKNSFSDEQGNFDAFAFNNYIDNLGNDEPGTEPGTKRRAWENFERYLLSNRTSTKYNALVEKGLTIPTWMAEQEQQKKNGSVSFDYVYAPYTDIADEEITVTDSDIESYLQKNEAAYQRKESADLKFVSYQIEPSDQDWDDASAWMSEKLNSWKTSKSDSLFIRLYSSEPFDKSYLKKDELLVQNSDSLFKAPIGTIIGPFKGDDSYEAHKLLDRKFIPDSLQARHLLLATENITTREQYSAVLNLADSLYTLVDSLDYELKDLTAQYSSDKANSSDGGDLGWIQPDQMVVPFNNAIFFEMKEGDVKMVFTQFGIHIVEVYNSTPTSEAVKIATLKKEVPASDVTRRNIYSSASLFAGNARSKEVFMAAEDSMTIKNAASVGKQSYTIPNVTGNARELVKWAFNNEVGSVSAPYLVGETYVVALLDKKQAKGLASVDDISVRTPVETKVRNEKKAELLAEKMNGSDLNSIAASAGKSVQSASSLNMSNTNISGVGNEPKVVGAAFGLDENAISNTIAGEKGVFVLQTTAKNPASTTDVASTKQSLKSQLSIGVTSKLSEAMQEASEIQDNRFEIF